MMINNLIVVDADILGLQLPERLQQNNGYPYEYHTYQRWQWQYEGVWKCLGVPLIQDKVVFCDVVEMATQRDTPKNSKGTKKINKA